MSPEPLPLPLEGGCLCGDVRYRIDVPPSEVVHCHCGLCRRSAGAAFVTWLSVRADAFRYTAGAPAAYRSSPRAVREHCARCGTSLSFRFDSPGDSIDVTAASLDRPELAEPGWHIWLESRLPWIRLDDGLPGQPRSDGAARRR